MDDRNVWSKVGNTRAGWPELRHYKVSATQERLSLDPCRLAVIQAAGCMHSPSASVAALLGHISTGTECFCQSLL